MQKYQDQSSIVFVSGVRGDTRRYRTLHPYEQFRLAGLPAAVSHITDPHLPDLITSAKVVIFHRVTFDRYVERLFRRLHSSGALVLLDADDLTFDSMAFQWIDSPDFQDPVRASLYQEDLERNHHTLDLCDGALVSTDDLAYQIGSTGKLTWVHRNAFSLEMLALSEMANATRVKQTDQVIVGYASGTPTHDTDFEVAAPAIRTVMGQNPHVRLWLIGPLQLGPEWAPFQERIRRFPLVPWRSLPALLAQFDVNLAPLVTGNPFARCKSEIKWMEAGLVRIPTVASPTPAFMTSIHNSENGFLAADLPEWELALSQLVQDSAYRQSVGEHAYQDVLSKYHPRVRARQLIHSLNEANLAVRGEPIWDEISQTSGSTTFIEGENGYLSPDLEAHPSLSEMGLYTLRNRGLLTLLKQEWIYFRRLVVPVFPYKRKERREGRIGGNVF